MSAVVQAERRRVRCRADLRRRRARRDGHDHGHVGVGLDRRRGEPLLLPRAPSWAPSASGCAGLALVVVAADRALVSAELAAARSSGLGLLVLVLVPAFGHAVNGSRRWLLLGPITVQASEPARLCLLLYLASYAVRRSTRARREPERLRQAAVRRRRGGRVAAARAGFRRDRRARRHEPRRCCSSAARGCAISCSPCSSAARVLDGARVLRRLSRRAAHVVPRSVGRSVRRRASSSRRR